MSLLARVHALRFFGFVTESKYLLVAKVEHENMFSDALDIMISWIYALLLLAFSILLILSINRKWLCFLHVFIRNELRLIGGNCVLILSSFTLVFWEMYTWKKLLFLHQFGIEKQVQFLLQVFDMLQWGLKMLNWNIYQFVGDKSQGKLLHFGWNFFFF